MNIKFLIFLVSCSIFNLLSFPLMADLYECLSPDRSHVIWRSKPCQNGEKTKSVNHITPATSQRSATPNRQHSPQANSAFKNGPSHVKPGSLSHLEKSMIDGVKDGTDGAIKGILMGIEAIGETAISIMNPSNKRD